MVLHLHVFPSASLHVLNDLSWRLIFPCYWLLDHLVASFLTTTREKRQCSQDPCASLTPCVLLSTPLYLLLMILWLPFALLGFLVWAPLQASRRPYIYTHRRAEVQQADKGRAPSVGLLGEWKPQGRAFSFVSANVCLLPDSLARINNLSDTQGRASELGKRICSGASRPQIKIYIDSPTDTSVSATSFSSLAQKGPGFSQTSCLYHKPDSTRVSEEQGACGPELQSEECLTLTGKRTIPECPLHSTEQHTLSECPLHSTGQHTLPDCPLHSTGQHTLPDCPIHSTGQPPLSDCPLHSTGQHPPLECPLHSTGKHTLPDCPLHSTERHTLPDCPLHSTEQHTLSDCPLHSTGQHTLPDCPLHSTGQHTLPDCPLHSTGQHSLPDCPLHSTGQQTLPDCPLHFTGQHTLPDCPVHSTEQHTIPDCHLHSSTGQPPLSDCPLHSTGQHNLPDCPVHSTGKHTLPDCPIHSIGQHTLPECPLHSTGQHNLPDCPLHSKEQHTLPDCPLHSTGQHTPPDCPLHSTGQHTLPDCPLHSTEQHTLPDCPLHSTGQHTFPDCPLHSTEQHTLPDCPLLSTEQHTLSDCPHHSAGVQNSISTPEQVPEEVKPTAEGEGSLNSCITSQESLPHFHSANRSVSNNSLSRHTSVPKESVGHRQCCVNETFDHEISAFFPANLDFLCLQEVFDKQAAVKLRQQLHLYFPFILSDVGRYAWKGCCSQFKFLNSGLLLASRYPILDADYYCYPNGRGEDALAAKGALFAKVLVGKHSQGQRIVGYIACTHLHSIEGHSTVRNEQLDLLLECGAYFRKATKRQKDQVAFDVVLGDLNFDNCSSEDKLEQQHAIFSRYKDPCRIGPGEDQCWALGTLLDISGLYDEEVNSPENMQKVMENEEGRKEYLVYPTGRKQCSNQKGRKIPLKGNGRRIDYILYSEEGMEPGWKVGVEEYSFITQLAGLTDHLAVGMRLAVSTGEEGS